jgi:hypothetical protein
MSIDKEIEFVKADFKFSQVTFVPVKNHELPALELPTTSYQNS